MNNNNNRMMKMDLIDGHVFAAVLYGGVSFLMNFANKAIFANTGFDSVGMILLFQFLFTIGGLHLLKGIGYVTYEPYTKSLGKELFVPSIMYCLNVAMALTSLSAISIPVYQVLKRLTPPAIVLLSRALLGKTESRDIYLSVAMILLGTVITGLGDLKFDFNAYVYGIISVVSQSLYLIYVQKTGVKHDVLTMMYANSVNCLPILIGQVILTGELNQAIEHPDIFSAWLWLHLFIIVFLGTVLNYALFLCTTKNSALSTTVVGVIKAVLSTILGFFVFGGQPLTMLLLVGISCNTGGAILYMYIRYLEKINKGNAPREMGEYSRVQSRDEADDHDDEESQRLTETQKDDDEEDEKAKMIQKEASPAE